MPVLSVIGTQWGDEGKGKIIDLIARRADVVVRYQGGANAGHTVVVDGEKFVFHVMPSGALHPGKQNVIANGVVVDPEQLLNEIDEFRKRKIDVEKRLFVSESAHVVMPYHKALDRLSEGVRGGLHIGTTGRGIGPAYADKYARTGIRMRELLDAERFAKHLSANLEEKNEILRFRFQAEPISFDAVLEEYTKYGERLRPFVADTRELLLEAIDAGQYVFIEGAQGTLLDIDFGTYPFVTSSNSSALGIAAGTGIPPKRVGEIMGVSKAYCTRVGEGPFPTEDQSPAGQHLQRVGGEYGATTGRPRRCGWFDGVAARYAIELNGVDTFALTKLDILSGLDEILVATRYRVDGQETDVFPSDALALHRCVPVYERLKGWREDLSQLRKDRDLPAAVRDYVHFLEDFLRIKVSILSVGPARDQTIFR
ncbi:MAG: adenylosuccinate synthase [Planctomycetota bacterium]